ncbi:hypothetical protein H4S06_000159 [Coemansia sp. BCRC 34490]|nr:hypothetical protein H4S06_000159 [Coemansia sp. BCRC 34490]
MRPHINNPVGAHFVGNLSFARSMLSSHVLVQAETNPENLSAVATNIRKGVAAMSEEYFSQLNNLLNKDIDAHMRLAMHTAKYKNRLMVSKISKYSHYKTDFGAGNPILVRPTLLSFPNVILIMPSRPDSDFDGYDIIMPLDKDTAKLVFQDKYWMELVDSYDYSV